jgi:acetyltransferase
MPTPAAGLPRPSTLPGPDASAPRAAATAQAATAQAATGQAVAPLPPPDPSGAAPEPSDHPLSRVVRLRDGTPITLRPLRADDAAELVRGFHSLSRESRYRRFLEIVDHLTPAQIDYLTRVDGHDHIAWVAAYRGEDGADHGAGVARSIREPGHYDTAEFAITLADPWQGRGVGRLLTEVVARDGWAHGVRFWRATMLADNVAVQRCMQKVGDEIVRHLEDRGAIEVVYKLRRAVCEPLSAPGAGG